MELAAERTQAENEDEEIERVQRPAAERGQVGVALCGGEQTKGLQQHHPESVHRGAGERFT